MRCTARDAGAAARGRQPQAAQLQAGRLAAGPLHPAAAACSLCLRSQSGEMLTDKHGRAITIDYGATFSPRYGMPGPRLSLAVASPASDASHSEARTAQPRAARAPHAAAPRAARAGAAPLQDIATRARLTPALLSQPPALTLTVVVDGHVREVPPPHAQARVPTQWLQVGALTGRQRRVAECAVSARSLAVLSLPSRIVTRCDAQLGFGSSEAWQAQGQPGRLTPLAALRAHRRQQPVRIGEALADVTGRLAMCPTRVGSDRCCIAECVSK